jgi:STIP1 family protein 1
LRKKSDLLAEIEQNFANNARDLLHANNALLAQGLLDQNQVDTEKEEIEKELQRKTAEIRNIFAIADPFNSRRREVPDYLVDNISFSIMQDPVVTKTGHSYDRATILEHLRRSETDPLTREHLQKDDLRPNLALKQACTEFLEENGWAADW